MRFFLHTIVVIMVLLFQVSKQCSENLCFTWSVTVDQLTLKCRASLLIHKVFIYNQIGLLQANCLPPFPSVHCEMFVANGTITQNISTNETIYVINGNIDTHLNGYWTCKHGAFKDVARVEVSILRIKDELITEIPTVQVTCSIQRNECMQETLLWSLVTFFSIVMIIMTSRAFCYTQTCFICALHKQERCASMRKCTHEKTVQRVKAILFCIFTLLYFGVTVVFTINKNKSCNYKHIFPAIGAMVALILGCLCIGYRRKIDVQSTLTCRPEEMENVNLQFPANDEETSV